MIEGHFAPPVLVSSIRQLYKTGALKIHCVVLRCEGFDATTVKQVRSTEKPPTVINVPSSRYSECFSRFAA